MKTKLITILLAICLIVFLASCGEIPNESSLDMQIEGSKQEPSHKDDAKKLTEKIFNSTPFSEGYAIVSTESGTYCIDSQGYIVYELQEEYKPVSNGYYDYGFQSGLVLINGTLYDTKGNATKPEDLGVTKFYSNALSAGYIVAEKVITTYDSVTSELGILNSDFEWLIELSEEFYEKASGRVIPLSLLTKAFDNYIVDGDCAIEISTGNIYDLNDNPPDGLGENGWMSYTDGSFRKGEDEIVFTVENANLGLTSWVNGKTVACFFNNNKYFFTLIDTSGNFTFEPVEICIPISSLGWPEFVYDGTYVFIYKVSESSAAIYDTSGNHISNSGDLKIRRATFHDGVVTDYTHSSDIKYYDINFNQLF